ncbi:leukemia inhibitory factor receptor-like, partial [Xenentodon cancila]
SETSGIGLNATVLNNLIPDCTNYVKVRCRTAQFWKWGDWSESVHFHTHGDVPDALDVWIHIKENKTVIMWKMPQANQSHGQIRHYEVAWAKTSSRDQKICQKVPFNKYNLTISLETNEEHVITVTAWNVNGSSPPSTIVTPSFRPDQAWMNTSWITGNAKGFSLSWLYSSFASCGYIVDWCPTVARGRVDWRKLSPDQTSFNINSENLINGLRYSMSIYACTQGAPVLLEKREGYVREIKIEDRLFKSLKLKQLDSDVTLSWDPVPLKEQTAFIHGYTLYYWDNNMKVLSVSTDNPEATSLTAKNLKIGSHTFTVAAQTAVGECGNATITATLNTQTDNLIKTIFISIGAVFGLLSLTTIICYRHWKCIKHKVYPPVPKPLLSDKWLHIVLLFTLITVSKAKMKWIFHNFTTNLENY